MDSWENKLYYFIQLELLRLEHLTKIFGQEQYPRYTPNANMADLSVGPGLVARKRGY